MKSDITARANVGREKEIEELIAGILNESKRKARKAGNAIALNRDLNLHGPASSSSLQKQASEKLGFLGKQFF